MSEPTRPTVFCKDCKFSPRWWLESYSHCLHQEAVEFSDNYLAKGDIHRKSLARMRNSFGACGPEAKLWEPRR